MDYVESLSIDIYFNKVVQQPTKPIYIHSVFERTINLIIENELYTVASNQLDNAPATLIIDIENFKTHNFSPNDLVTLSNKVMKIAEHLSIDLSTAISWKSELPTFPIRQNRLCENLNLAMNFLVEEGKADWLRKATDNQSPFQKEMGRMLQERTIDLITSFEFDDLGEQLKRARQLIGLGQGLTPSGDDFLVGLLLAFSTLKKDESYKKTWASLVIDEAEKKTNIISYSSLKYALNGETRESVSRLFQALFTKKKSEVEQALRHVMDIGSSSGTEISWGILNGLLLILKQEGHNDNKSKDKKKYVF